jgi:hypothetical protein
LSFRTNRKTKNIFYRDAAERRAYYESRLMKGPITVYNESEIEGVKNIAKSQGYDSFVIQRRGNAIDIYYGKIE